MSAVLYCRFCAEEKPLHEIIDLGFDLKTRTEVIEKLSLFAIKYINFSEKSLPETMCRSCFDTLNVTHEFLTKIKVSQVILSSISTKYYKTENTDDTGYEDCGVQGDDDVQSSRDSKHTIVELTKLENEDMYTDMSWNSYPWHCKYCKLKLDSKEAVRKHCIQYHGACYGFQCVDCDEDLDNFYVFVDHVREHRKNLNNYCQYCNIKVENIQHIQTHTIGLNCMYCGEIFINETSLQIHFRKYQPRSRNRLSKRKLSELKELLSFGVEICEPEDIKIDSWKDYPWICQICRMRFPDQVMLRSHSKEVHKKCFGVKCADCNINLENFEDFIEHVRAHRPSLEYRCEYCDIKTTCANNNVIHINQHLEDCMQCDSCGELFRNKLDLQNHISIYNQPKPKRVPFKRRGRPITEEDLTCEVCGKQTKSLNTLRAHKKVHTVRNRDYTCDRCGKAFFTKGALSAHNIIHENPEPQICIICKKSFLTLTRLKKHVKTHNSDKPFQCTECHRSFRLKEHLKGHMITHTNIMPYTCQYCHKNFRHRNVLKIHENQHTGARPYCCDICNMEFANWSNCNKHLKRKHGTTLAKSMMTPQGKIPINPKTGKPKKLKDLDTVKEWTEQIMVPCKRGKKTSNEYFNNVQSANDFSV